MAHLRITQALAAAALVGTLAACSSSGSGSTHSAATNPVPLSTPGSPASSTGSSSTPSPTAADSSTPAPATSTSASPAQGVGALLASFSAGPITVKHMPTADKSWLARVQTEAVFPQSYPKVTDPKLLNLLALVDEAAREKDIKALTRLCSADACDPKTQAPLWNKPGVLAGLSTILEKTHRSEGDLFPGFILAGGGSDPSDVADLKALGATSATDYIKNHGAVATSFADGTGGQNPPPEQWNGVSIWPLYPTS